MKCQEDWTIENLLRSHRSRPYNPDVANVFFRAGEIETWGRGIERIVKVCKSYGCPDPTFRYSTGEMWMIFHICQKSMLLIFPIMVSFYLQSKSMIIASC